MTMKDYDSVLESKHLWWCPLQLIDEANRRVLDIHKEGFPDAVRAAEPQCLLYELCRRMWSVWFAHDTAWDSDLMPTT